MEKILMHQLKIKVFKLLSAFLLTVCSLAMVSMVAYADTQRIVNYNYDGAGNIISIRSGQNQGPPDVTILSPAFIHKESFAFVTATGINLFEAAVNVNTPGISLVEVNHISETEIKLTRYQPWRANARAGSPQKA
jgi:hypothetical protein